MAVILSFVGKWNGSDLKKFDAEMAKMRKGSDYNKVSLKNLGLAAGAATAAVGAMAIKIGTDSVKAAIAEEKSVAALSQTMKNLGMASQDAGMQSWIDDLQFSTGVADDLVRGPMARLLVATKDVTKAQSALQTALDLSAQGYGSVDAISTALSKAFGGNTTALKRLGIPLDNAKVKAGDLEGVLADLARTSRGQAARAAGTLAGQLKILSIGVDELKESAGKGFLEGLLGDPESTKSSTKELSDNMREMQTSVESVSKAFGEFVKGTITGAAYVQQGVGSLVVQAFDLAAGYSRAKINFNDLVGYLSDEDAQRARDLLDAEWAARHAAAAADVFGIELGDAAIGAKDLGRETSTANKAIGGLDDASGTVDGLATSFYNAQNNAKGAASAVDALKSALDKLNGVQRTVRQTEADYFAAIREAAKVGKYTSIGPGGKKETRVRKPRLNAAGGLDLSTQLGADADAALGSIASGAEERAAAILAAGGPNAVNRAADALEQGRKAVARRARAYGMTKFGTYLPKTPQDLIQRQENQARAASMTNYYVFNGDLNVASLPDAAKVAKQAARLRNLNGGRNVRTEVLTGAGVS